MSLHTKNKNIHFEDIVHTHLKQSSSCIFLGIDIIKKKNFIQHAIVFEFNIIANYEVK